MGQFRVTVVAVGGHGCQRDKDGTEELAGCGQPECTDCLTRAYVEQLKAIASVSEATIHHWPGSGARPDGRGGEVLDNLLSKRRIGSFR